MLKPLKKSLLLMLLTISITVPLFSHAAIPSKDIDLTIPAGWSMISSAVIDEHTVQELLSEKPEITTIMEYSGGQSDGSNHSYKPASSIQPLHGYWVHSSESTEINLFGQLALPIDYSHLTSGWNMIGANSPDQLQLQSTIESLTPYSVERIYTYSSDGGWGVYDLSRAISDSQNIPSSRSGIWVNLVSQQTPEQLTQPNDQELEVVDGFDYPMGDRGYTDTRIRTLHEQINPENNDTYTNNTVSTDNHTRLAITGANAANWRNSQDAGSYYDDMGGLHPGEDWNLGAGNSDAGEAIYAIADGQVHTIAHTYSSGLGNGGWTIVLEHRLQNGANLYSIYTHVTSANETAGGLTGQEEGFTIAEGDMVDKGEMVARLVHGNQMAYITSAHLHFELRTQEPSQTDLWNNDNGNGYYSHDGSKDTDGMTAAQIQTAITTMQNLVGLVDPSDYVEANRIAPHLLTGAVVNQIATQGMTPGSTATITVAGESLSSQIAISLHGSSSCTIPIVSQDGTTATVDCKVPSDAAGDLRLYIAHFSGSAPIPDQAGITEHTVTIGEDALLLQPPANLTATAGDGSVTLSWDAVNGAESYTVYRATESGITLANVSGVEQTLNATSPITASNLTNGTTYWFAVTSIKDTTESLLSEEVSATPQAAVSTVTSLPLNDTGITWGGNYSSGNNQSCIGETISAQDCSHGRDVTHNDDSDGHAGFSFTKLDSSGSELPASAESWSCVKDNITGLIWEVKSDDGGIHDKDNTYRWGGLSAIGRDHVNRKGSYYDDWNGLVNGSNSSAFCGYSDWRVPGREALRSIVNYDRSNPAIDTSYFPNFPNSGSAWFWSSSPYAYSSNAWKFSFNYGSDGYYYRGSYGHVRLVRGGQ